ncbi:hypothetical protein ABFV57_00880 [Pseudomonas neuropathica]|uniref:hypothetical protein n=1 Tax=Pseudomonas neuropathica TaxID=2730425 RepID=UPI0034D6DC48
MSTAPEKVSIVTMTATINSAVSLVINGAKLQQGQIIGIYEHHLTIRKSNGAEVDIPYNEISALALDGVRPYICEIDGKQFICELPDNPMEAINVKSITLMNLPEKTERSGSVNIGEPEGSFLPIGPPVPLFSYTTISFNMLEAGK